ncbi:unnamed protein product [Penicillium salamii]|uniref:Uncharacterized protein n=1 Tax=Penicillium salamii TaxID=1612424 RepID=A0A9W4N7X5_9EURO|nr:unnamed protein product [Penicillium salamii]
MKDESPHEPLLAYLDPADIQKHVTPWQEIIMFFARTQAHANHPRPIPADEPEPFEIRPIKHALLNFCIDLLQQEIRNNEYGCAIICATAVIRRRQFGWATPKNFPPRISSLIKITRFLVLHKALRLDPRSLEIRRGFAGQADQRWFTGDIIQFDEAYTYKDTGSPRAPSSPMAIRRSPPTQDERLGPLTPAQQQPPTQTFPQWVKYLVDLFMVRGTNSPIQW